MSIPIFDENGVLPPGDYEVTFAQLRESILVNGIGEEGWDREWRLKLVNSAEILVEQLWQVGITEVFLDGSFVEDKFHPNDIDGYFVCDATKFNELTRDLNILNPYKVWTWDPSTRRAYAGFTKKQLPMWHHYRVELYPHFGQLAGIVDEHGHQQQFPAAFRKQRQTFVKKGIIQILKEGETT